MLPVIQMLEKAANIINNNLAFWPSKNSDFLIGYQINLSVCKIRGIKTRISNIHFFAFGSPEAVGELQGQ